MKISIVSIFIIVVLFACGGGQEGPSKYDEASATKLFKKYCMVCHGMDGKLGLNGAKDLTVCPLGFQERVQLVTNGRGAMTPFKGILTEDEIEQVSQYTLNLKK